MYFFASDNIHMPSLPTSRECFYRLVYYHQVNHHFAFCGEDPTTNVVVYQYTRHIFGAKDSPTCANYALQRTVRDNAKFHPEAAISVLENFYMDDYLVSVESPEKAVNRSKELVHLGGFKLTKFVSNVPNLADRIDGSPQSTEPKVIVTSGGFITCAKAKVGSH